MYNIRNHFNFAEFVQKYRKMISHNIPSNEFLEWFIGFSEGDGCFTFSKNNELIFIISQSNKDKKVLEMIKSNLGFGSINKQSKTVDRFVVRKKNDIDIIISIFNGNIILPTKKIQFYNWMNKGKNNIPIIYNNIIPSKENY